MKLIIKSPCVVKGGKIADFGTVIETEDEQEIYTLIAAGRALDMSTAEGKQLKAEIDAAVEDGADVKKKK